MTFVHIIYNLATHEQVATLVEADWLFLMTDVDCLYTANPKVSTDHLDPSLLPHSLIRL